MKSGVGIAPPERIRSTAVATSAPIVPPRSTCQCWSDVIAAKKSAAIPDQDHTGNDTDNKDDDNNNSDRDDSNNEDGDDNDNDNGDRDDSDNDNRDGDDNRDRDDNRDDNDNGDDNGNENGDGDDNDNGDDENGDDNENGQIDMIDNDEGSKQNDSNPTTSASCLAATPIHDHRGELPTPSHDRAPPRDPH